jgi:peptide deformylase
MPSKIIAPHKNVSRLVKPDEAMLVFKESEKIFPLLDTPIGLYRNFYAIAHPQIEADRPLRFFVVNPNAMEFLGYRSVVIVNPVIERHTNQEVDSEEGCATFSKRPPAKVKRWNKCEDAFSPRVFDENKVPMIGARIHLKLNGKVAKIFQHEIDHLDAKYIY